MEDQDDSHASAGEKRRRRPPLACIACRRRKVRCDRKMPCQNCVRARRATSCAYVSDDRIEPREGTQGFNDGINGRSLDKDDVISVPFPSPATTGRSRNNQSEGSTTTAAAGDAAALTERVRQLEQQLSRVLESNRSETAGSKPAPLSTANPPTASSFLGEEYWQINHAASKAPGLNTAEDAASTRVMMAKTRYLGSSHWIHGITLFPRTNTLILFLESLKSDKSSTTYQAIAASKCLGRTIKAARVPRLSMDFGQHIPSKELVDHLLDIYFRTFETVYRILHVPSFRLEYGRFWQNPKAARGAFIIQLQLCLALASTMYDNTYSLRNLAVRWVYEARLWLLQPSEKSRINLSGLQVWCLIHLAREVCGVGSDLVWCSAGTMMRMALYTGLHRDPDYLPKMSLLAAETRRRLWATILEILVQSSLESGGPPLISPHDFDTKAPGNYNDEDLLGDNVAPEPPPPHPTTAFTDTSVQIAMLNSIKIRLQIVSHLNEFRSVPSYDKTLALNSELTTASRGLDTLLRLYQAQQPGISAFQLCAIEHIIQRYFLALHLPWLGAAKDDPRYFFSRKLCVEVSLRNQNAAQEHGYSGTACGAETDDFGRLLLCGSGGYRYLGTQCLLALTLQLIWELDESREAARNLGVSISDLTPTSGIPPNPMSAHGMGFGLVGVHWHELLNVLRQSTLWMKARIRAGEVNVKGYLFGCAMMAEAEALQRGLSDEELEPLVRNASAEASTEALGILKELHAITLQGDDALPAASKPTNGTENIPNPRYTGMDGTQVPGPGDDFATMDTGSSGQLSDWDWEMLQDPNFNFNLSLGGMELMFGDTY